MFLSLPDPDPLVRGMDLDPNLDPDPLVRGMDSRIRIRIHTKMSWIRFRHVGGELKLTLGGCKRCSGEAGQRGRGSSSPSILG
jgi:hypothetical protein